MKKSVLLLVFFFTISIGFANTNPIKNSSTNPTKKVNLKSKTEKKNNSFLLWSNPYKISTFCRLIQTGNYKAVKALIEQGEDVNKASNKLTPLMYAARHNRVEIIKLLIANGANLKAKSDKGYTALKWAKIVNAKEAYQVLEKALKNQKK